MMIKYVLSSILFYVINIFLLRNTHIVAIEKKKKKKIREARLRKL